MFNDIKNNCSNITNEIDKKLFKIFAKLIRIHGEEGFKAMCPACYSLLRVHVFFYLLEQKGTKGPKGRLGLTFGNNEKSITIDLNCFPDLKLSAPYLPYIRSFITQDKSQSILLQKLFPEFSFKIRYIQQNNN